MISTTGLEVLSETLRNLERVSSYDFNGCEKCKRMIFSKFSRFYSYKRVLYKMVHKTKLSIPLVLNLMDYIVMPNFDKCK